MKRNALLFEDLHQNFQVLTSIEQTKITGGLTWEYAIDPNNNWYYREAGSDTWIAGNSLEEVVILSASGGGGGSVSSGGDYSGGTSSGGPGGVGGGNTSTPNYSNPNDPKNRPYSSEYRDLLNALGTTSEMFGAVMSSAADLAKLGDFAHDATVLLKSVGKYSGYLGTAIDLITTTVDVLEDGKITPDEAA
jgi:hypothetical protein